MKEPLTQLQLKKTLQYHKKAVTHFEKRLHHQAWLKTRDKKKWN